MLSDKPVFAELFGLALFDLNQLSSFQKLHSLSDDLLQEFTTSEYGELSTREGVIVPILDIPGEYYLISVVTPDQDTILGKNQDKIISTGWILNSPTGEITVCGIGYLKKFNKIEFSSNQKFIRLQIPTGWSNLTISGGITSQEDLIYELRFTPCSSKPVFEGNLADNFNLLDS